MIQILTAHALLVLRVATFVGFSPLRHAVPDRFVRFAISCALAVAWLHVTPETVQLATRFGNGIAIWLLMAAREALIGWTVGYAASLYILPAQVAGDLIGRNMGINLGQLADPVTSVPLPLLPHLFQMLALVIFFVADVHHAWILLLDASMQGWGQLLPAVFLRPDLAALALQGAYDDGVAIAGVLLLVNFALLVIVAALARAMPSFNYFSIGLGTQILGGLLAFYIFTPAIVAAVMLGSRQWTEWAYRLLGG